MCSSMRTGGIVDDFSDVTLGFVMVEDFRAAKTALP